MTSVYTEKIYPDISSAPEDDISQTYRLKKIEEVENFLREEIKERSKYKKRYKRKRIVLTILAGSSTAASAATASTVIALPLAVGLAPLGLLAGFGSVIITLKIQKHTKLKTLAESKLDSISKLISKAIEDTIISHNEYHFILREKENYLAIKEQIQKKSQKQINAFAKEKQEALLAQGRKEGEQAFLRKIAASSAIPTVNAM